MSSITKEYILKVRSIISGVVNGVGNIAIVGVVVDRSSGEIVKKMDKFMPSDVYASGEYISVVNEWIKEVREEYKNVVLDSTKLMSLHLAP